MSAAAPSVNGTSTIVGQPLADVNAEAGLARSGTIYR